MSTPAPSIISPAPVPEERVETRRYLDAIRRNSRLIAAIVVLITGAVVGASLALPNVYKGTTSLVLDEQSFGVSGTADSESTSRRLNTTQLLITAPRVLDAAARDLPDETRDSLEGTITASVDPEANLVTVDATDDTPEGAAQNANTVSRTFLEERADLERERIRRARQRLEDEVAQLEARPNAQEQVAALRARISQLSVAEGSAGSDLQLVSNAEVPTNPDSPRPLRNGVLAFFGALFLGILIALGRDQLAPRLTSPRELGRMLDLRVLTGVPYVQGLWRRRTRVMSGVEAEAYETLRSLVELDAPSEEGQQSILFTGAVHGEGKTTASWRTAHALARAGHRVLVVTADLRVPRMHELAGVPLGLGLADVLAIIDWEGGDPDEEILAQAIKEIMVAGPGKRKKGALHLITSGTKAKDPGRLIAGHGMEAFLQFVRQLDYAYVIIDAPPMIGIADSQVLARLADHVILVHRLDRLTVDNVADLRQILDAMESTPLGIVVIGARAEVSPYYLQRRPTIVQTGSERG